jgi:SMC interacting uncharacterized protein involved in chromosome segregation
MMSTVVELSLAISKLDSEINQVESELLRLQAVRDNLLKTFKKVCTHKNCKMLGDDECICLDCGSKV